MAFAVTETRRGIIEPPRRPPWLIALDLYRGGGSFRGFLEFAVIGAIVLSFLPGGGLGDNAMSWMRGLTGQAPASAPATAPQSVLTPALSKPRLPLAPRIADLKIEPSYFDRVDEPLRSQLRSSLSAYYARDPRAAIKAIDNTHAEERHVLLMQGLNLLSIPGTPSVTAGVKLLQQAADEGEPRAAAMLGVLKVSGLPDLTRDPEAGRALLARASAAGDAAAARVMGEGFVTGWMGVVDPAKAEQYLRLASERGDLRGTMRLGEMFLTGHGVPRNEREGERLIRKAAIDGYPEAQAMLGVLRFLPYAGGLTDDPDEALEWLERAAAQSEPHGMYYLGMFHAEYGKRIGRLDLSRGVELFRRCTEKTLYRECVFAFATALDLGLGTPRDPVKAYAVYSIAAANDAAGKARARRDEVGKALTSEQIVRAHQIANELIAKSAPPKPHVRSSFADVQRERRQP